MDMGFIEVYYIRNIRHGIVYFIDIKEISKKNQLQAIGINIH